MKFHEADRVTRGGGKKSSDDANSHFAIELQNEDDEGTPVIPLCYTLFRRGVASSMKLRRICEKFPRRALNVSWKYCVW